MVHGVLAGRLCEPCVRVALMHHARSSRWHALRNTVVPLPLLPGNPSAATAFYYNIYQLTSETPVNAQPLLAASETADGATAPATPTGGTNYMGLTTSDRLSFSTGNLASLSGLTLPAGVYQVSGPWCCLACVPDLMRGPSKGSSPCGSQNCRDAWSCPAQITVLAFNSMAPDGSQWSEASEKSDVVSQGSPGGKPPG